MTSKQYWSYLCKKFKMELVKSMPIYFVAMLKSIITITEVLFVSALVHIVDGVRSKPQTPRGTKFVNLHKNIPRKVNIIFINQP
jgi:fumarate reductase subunit C